MRNRPTLSNCNLTGCGANRILKNGARSAKVAPALRPIALRIIRMAHDLIVKPPPLWRIMRGPRGGNTGPVRDEQPAPGLGRPKPPRRLGLSGKLLLLTIPLIMI